MNNPKHRATLEQWRILQAVVDHGGYAQAGEALHRSPSSLNHAVSKLQHQLGVPLLEIQGRKAYLTDQGEVLLRRSRQLTEDAYSLETLAENLEIGWEPEINLAVEILFPRTVLYQALKDFYPDSRGTRLKIKSTVISGTIEAITEGTCDLVISADIPKGYLGEYIGNVKLVAVAHPSHPLVLAAEVDQKQLTNHLQIVISESGKQPADNRGWLRSEQRWTVSDFNAAIDMMETGIGFCWVPLHLVENAIKEQRLSLINLKESRTRELPIHLVVPRPDQLGPCAQQLLLHLRDIPKLTY